MEQQTPQIGQRWPGQGGTYAGVARGRDGQPDYHLILADAVPAKKLKWKAAVSWATKVEADGHTDFALPTRWESALLYANVQDQIDTDWWYWTGTQYSESYAFLQYFLYGTQGYYDKSAEARARAVRRLPINPSVLSTDGAGSEVAA